MNQNKFDALLANSAKALSDAQVRHQTLSAVIGGLSAQAPAPEAVQDFGYCADCSVDFAFKEGLLAQLLAAYPAEDLYLVRDGSLAQKPYPRVRQQEWESSAVVPLAPLLYKSSGREKNGTLVWWSKLSSGHLAQMHMRNSPHSEFESHVGAPRFQLDSHSYSSGSTSYGVRALTQAPSRPGALQQWFTAWDEFSNENLTAGMRQFMNAIRHQIQSESGADWESAGWPASTGSRLSAVVSAGPGQDLMEELDKALAHRTQRSQRHPHWLDRVGDFWQYFDDSRAAKLWAFCLSQKSAWTAALETDAKELAQVQQVLSTIFSKGHLVENDHATRSRVIQYVVLQTGLSIKIQIMRYNHQANRMDVDFAVSPHSSRAMHRAFFPTTPAPLRPQDLPAVYVS